MRTPANTSAYGRSELVEAVEDRVGDAEHRVVLPSAAGTSRRAPPRPQVASAHESRAPAITVPQTYGQNWPGLRQHRAPQHAACPPTPSSPSTRGRDADVAADLVVRDPPRHAAAVAVVVAADRPQRLVGRASSRGHPRDLVRRAEPQQRVVRAPARRRARSPIAASTAAAHVVAHRVEPRSPTRARSRRAAAARRPRARSGSPGTGPSRTRRPSRPRPTRRAGSTERPSTTISSLLRPIGHMRACVRPHAHGSVDSRTMSSER